MKSDFIVEYLFNKLKDEAFNGIADFKCYLTRNKFENKLKTSEITLLYNRIINYQVNKYGESLRKNYNEWNYYNTYDR